MSFTITPTFDSTISNDPNAKSIEDVINSAISIYESAITSPINVNIDFKEVSTGLGKSSKPVISVSYQSYYNALNSNTNKSADDIAAIASLPNTSENPVTSGSNIEVPTSLARALGFSPANPPSSNEYDGTIFLNTSITNPGSPNTTGEYSLQVTVEHEIDEVLGLGSGLLQGETPIRLPEPEDLFRYAAPNTRSYNTTDTAYLSFDAGVTNLATFNKKLGGDFADWDSTADRVQNAYQDSGTTPSLGIELSTLKVLGYDVKKEVDLAFVIDTTGSTDPYLASFKSEAENILNSLNSSGVDYRVAVVDYKDFPPPGPGDPGDYVYNPDLAFSSDPTAISNAIENLGPSEGGGDIPEAAYSALTDTINGDDLGAWRNGSQKDIVIMTDAPPHDPEPYTGYTEDSVIQAANNADPIAIYSIVPGVNDNSYTAQAYQTFSNISAQTGGQFFATPTSSDIQNAFLNITNQIIQPPITSANNDIVNPNGFSSQHWLTANAIPYTINFTNNTSPVTITSGDTSTVQISTNPVSQVTIAETLDPSLDLSTFQLGSFGFEGNTYNVPQGLQNYSQQIDLTSTQGILVNVTAALDTSTRIVSWTFTSIDPTTGKPVTDPTKGFLPPNDQSGSGSGYVSYTIQPNADVADSTVINAQATINFDSQTPIQTPKVFNTIEENPPSSSVNPLPTTETNPNFTVSWTGSDTDSGIASYDIYISTNGGQYTLWQNNTTATSATYTGQAGNTYAFYSVATDNAGLTEAAHDTYDTETTVQSNVISPNQQTFSQVGTSDVFQTNSSDASPILLLATIAGFNSNNVDELGVFRVDTSGDVIDASGNIIAASGATNYTQAALQNGQVVLSAIANSPNGYSNSDINSYLQLPSGSNLRFYLIQNSTTNNVLAGNTSTSNVLFLNSANQQIQSAGTNSYNLNWNDSSTNSSQNLVVNVQSTSEQVPLGANLQVSKGLDVIDLTGISSDQQVTASFILNREAAYNNFGGLYTVDQSGDVIGKDGSIAAYNPSTGKSTYAQYDQAAVSNMVQGVNLVVGNQQTIQANSTLTGGAIYAPFLIQNDTNPSDVDGTSNAPQVFFPFLGANSDNFDHVRLLGNNIFSFEDQTGGGDKDYNDMIIRVNLSLA